MGFSIDIIEETKLIWTTPNSIFPGKLNIEDRKKVILERKSIKAYLKL